MPGYSASHTTLRSATATLLVVSKCDRYAFLSGRFFAQINLHSKFTKEHPEFLSHSHLVRSSTHKLKSLITIPRNQNPFNRRQNFRCPLSQVNFPYPSIRFAQSHTTTDPDRISTPFGDSSARARFSSHWISQIRKATAQ